jgi:hypothetical protein
MRVISAWAKGPCHLLAFSQVDWNKVKKHFAQRISQVKVAFLKEIPLLRFLTPTNLRKLEPVFIPVRYAMH